MAIYPFYTRIKSSTRDTETGVGCRAKDGYLTTTVLQRSQGDIVTAFQIEQCTYYNHDTGVRTLRCVVKDSDGNQVAMKETLY